MANPITITRDGQRVYFGGDTYAAKDRIKALGGHWDADKRAWWVGAKKEAEARALAAELNAAEAPLHPLAEDPDKVRLTGKGRYKGRVYYCGAITRDGTRVRLLTLPDTKGDYLDFWADCSEVEQLKRYEPREERGAYGRPTGRMVYTTLGSIQRFLAEQKVARDRGDPVCAACGTSGELVQDLEDGCLKHLRCCDIPPC